MNTAEQAKMAITHLASVLRRAITEIEEGNKEAAIGNIDWVASELEISVGLRKRGQ